METKHKNIGVTANPSSLLYTSSPSSSFTDIIDQMFDKNDADNESSVEVQNTKYPTDRNYNSDTDADYYAMKSKGRKEHKGRPSKIEFQMVNRNLKKKIHQNTIMINENEQREKHNKNCQCQSQHYNNFQNQSNSQIPSYIQSAQNQFTLTQHQPQSSETLREGKESLRSKIRKNFSYATNDEGKSNAATADDDNDDKTNANFYYFDHGDCQYLRTTDKVPHLITENVSKRVYSFGTRFWAEFFGSINVCLAFFVAFCHQFVRFLSDSILRRLIVGSLQMVTDYFLKPLLTTLFNGMIQPVLAFLRNTFQSLWNAFEPIAQMIFGFCIPFIECLRAIRLVDVNINSKRENRKYLTDEYDA